MNKKAILSCMMVGMLAFGTGVGTMARYVSNYNSEDNTLRSAEFNVSVNSAGGEFKDSAFTLVGRDLKPGTEKQLYTFEINKNDTEVDLEYEVGLVQEGKLFKEGTPVQISLQKETDNGWKNIGLDSKFKPENDTEKFKIMLNWPAETDGVNDADYAGETGKININVTASQFIEENNPPVGPTKPVTITSPSIVIGVNSSKRQPSLMNIDIKYYKNENGLKVIEFEDLYKDFAWHIDMKNPVLTQNEIGSDEYTLTCTGTEGLDAGGDWNGKIFKLTTDTTEIQGKTKAQFKFANTEEEKSYQSIKNYSWNADIDFVKWLSE